MPKSNEKYHCEKCGKELDAINFFTYKNKTKMEICKKCLTMHVNNYKPETFLWILEKLDIPYVENEWNAVLDKQVNRYGAKKINGLSVLGKYLSKMRLNKWGECGWADTERLREEMEAAAPNFVSGEKQAEMKEKFENGEISQAEYLTYTSTVSLQGTEYLDKFSEANQNFEDFIGTNNYYDESKFIAETDLPSAEDQLTQDDKIYLAMKWGRLYTADQWVSLEKKYNEMQQSFDIQDSDTEGTLIILCKTYLKMNEALDMSDIEGYQKLQKAYNDLRRSAKFTAAQNKEETGDFVDSIGEIVAYCESEGGKIPRFDISVDYDVFDKVIRDLKDFTRDLIYEDTALARQIEDYVKKKEISDQIAENRKKAKENPDEAVLTDQDYIDFTNQMLENEEHDHSEYMEDQGMESEGDENES